jgi:hypothetical protein
MRRTLDTLLAILPVVGVIWLLGALFVLAGNVTDTSGPTLVSTGRAIVWPVLVVKHAVIAIIKD